MDSCKYNFKLNVASDIGIDSYFLLPENIEMQDFHNQVDAWADENQMVLNIKKTKYIIFNRAQADFNTRLKFKDINIEQVHEARVLGVIVSYDLKFERNTKDICSRAFAGISMLTKLKYVGVSTKDLVGVFSLFI